MKKFEVIFEMTYTGQESYNLSIYAIAKSEKEAIQGAKEQVSSLFSDAESATYLSCSLMEKQ